MIWNVPAYKPRKLARRQIQWYDSLPVFADEYPQYEL